MTDKLRKLLDDSTPRPWEAKHQGLTDGYPNVIVNAEDSGYPGAVLWGIRAEKDAALIVSAVNNLEYLLAVVEAARALVGSWPDTEHRTCGDDCSVAKTRKALTALDNHLEQQ